MALSDLIYKSIGLFVPVFSGTIIYGLFLPYLAPFIGVLIYRYDYSFPISPERSGTTGTISDPIRSRKTTPKGVDGIFGERLDFGPPERMGRWMLKNLNGGFVGRA